MNYTPTIWSNGMKITAARLNKIENGITNITAPSVLILVPTITQGTTYNTITLNYSYNDIKNAFLSGTNIYYMANEYTYAIIETIEFYEYENTYECYINEFDFFSKNASSNLIYQQSNVVMN